MVKEYRPVVGSLPHRIHLLKRGQSIWTDKIRTANSEIQRLNIRFPDKQYRGKTYVAIPKIGTAMVALIRIKREK